MRAARPRPRLGRALPGVPLAPGASCKPPRIAHLPRRCGPRGGLCLLTPAHHLHRANLGRTDRAGRVPHGPPDRPEGGLSGVAGRQGGARRLVMSHMRSIVASVVTAHALTSTGAVMAQTSLTIYNDGRVLVRRNVEANVPKGTSQQRFTLGQIEPGSLVSLDPDVAVVGTTYDGDVSMDRALRRLVGREITVERPQPGGGY